MSVMSLPRLDQKVSSELTQYDDVVEGPSF